MSDLIEVQGVEMRGEAMVVEWDDGGCPRRAIVPAVAAVSGRCERETLERGIPYGDDFAAALEGVEMPSPEGVECALHKLGLWDGEDLRRSPGLLKVALEKAFAPVTVALLRGSGRKAREKERAAYRDQDNQI